MPFCNTDILIQNILSLMKANDITQEKLATILGMSQSNVSKALSLKDKKCFTLDQIVGIANHFGVSIDFLVGNKSAKSQEASPRAIAKFLSEVIENHDAKCTSVQIEESVFEPEKEFVSEFDDYYWEASEKKRTNTYLAVYFPDYWQLPDPDKVGPETFDMYHAEATQIGNATHMKPVNDFLRKFTQIFEVFENKGIDEEAYRVVVDNYLSKLHET